MEQKTVSMYVVDSAKRDLPDGSTKKHLFCHRSWNYRKKGNDLRMTKSLGTNKINRACPSKIEITTFESEGVSTIKVKFWSTHCGHAHEDNIREEKEDLLSFIQVSQECKPDTNENIISKLGLIQRLCVTRQISKEDANLVEKKMDDILKILNKTDRIHETKEKVNIRKKIDPQLRLYSTKKRKIEKNQLQKPSLHEVNAIREGLDDDNHAINIHGAFDHTYDQH